MKDYWCWIEGDIKCNIVWTIAGGNYTHTNVLLFKVSNY